MAYCPCYHPFTNTFGISRAFASSADIMRGSNKAIVFVDDSVSDSTSTAISCWGGVQRVDWDGGVGHVQSYY